MSNRGTTIDYPVTGISKGIVSFSTAPVELIFALVVSDNKFFDVTHFGWWWLADSPQKLWQLFLSRSLFSAAPHPEKPFLPVEKRIKSEKWACLFQLFIPETGAAAILQYMVASTEASGEPGSLSKFRDCTDLGISSSAQYISFTVGRPASGRLLCCLLGWFFAPILWIKMIRSSSRTLGEEFLFFPLGNVRNAYNKKSSKIDFIILYSLAPKMLSGTDFLCRTCHEVG